MKLLTTDTYLAVVRNSIGSNMFRNLYAEVDGEKTDILNNGELSCAYFVSSVLYLFKLVDAVHATVSGTEKDLENSGWTEIEEPKAGAVLVWGEIDFGGGSLHRHIGFYTGDDKAVSNDYKTGTPQEHDWKFNGERKLEKILWNTKLQ